MIKWKNDRPEGWKQAYIVPTPSLKEIALAEQTGVVRFLENEAREAGATALLELLRASGVRTDSFRTNHNPVYLSNPNQKGHYVFIPKK